MQHTHLPLKKYQLILSNIQQVGVGGEVLLPMYYALFPWQPSDKSVTINTVDRVKCPKTNNIHDIVIKKPNFIKKHKHKWWQQIHPEVKTSVN